MSTRVKEIIEEVDNYDQTLNATLATLHLYKFDDFTSFVDESIKYWFGKKMMPGELTPDLNIQLNGERGVIIELKRSLPRNDSEGKDLWEEQFNQLSQYDTDLEGWETQNKKINEQDLILLTSQKLGIAVNDYIDEKDLKFTNFSKNFSVWEFNSVQGVKQAVFLRKIKGEITEFKNIINERLRRGISISLEYLFSSGLSKVKFLDYKPNTVYLMSVLWDFIFSTKPTFEDWREARESKGRKNIDIPMNLDEIKEIINSNFTLDGQNNLVKKEWIKEAMENFVKLKLAKRGTNTEDYIIKFRKIIEDQKTGERKEEVFARLLFGEAVQTTLDK